MSEDEQRAEIPEVKPSQEQVEEETQATQEEVVEEVKEPEPVEYKCFSCNKFVSETYIRKKVRCPYCGSKIIFKNRSKPNTVVAR